ncbi:hypothetical protein GCM10010123_37630 [Pilimelia anulata]|uniref:Fibronectin type-III domain-containing protein n=1 Tax=Pilimelia anulata TaxID=53371 RepID=A0A8J3BCJ9_9ACTN|nr:hypothetical protein [Pilimelia anulata]GGK04167.1 hypothetical protein GCM10010123_37630 [Pilimelia anulata]
MGSRRRVLSIVGSVLLIAVVGSCLAVVPAAGAAFRGTTANPVSALDVGSVAPPTSFAYNRACTVSHPGTTPAVRGSGSTSNSNTSSLAISTPSTASGDYLVAAVYAQKSSPPTITPPSGWTALYSQTAGTNVRVGVYYRESPGSSPSSYTFSLSSSAEMEIVMGSYSNTNSVDASNVVSTTGSTGQIPSVTPSAGPTRLVGFIGTAAASAGTPSGMTQRSSGSSLYLFDQSIAGTGATGTKNSSLSGSAATVGVAVLLTAATIDPDVDFSWTATVTTSATGYEITRTVGSTTGISGRTTTSWTDTTTSANTAYTYSISSVRGSWRSTSPSVNVPAC